MPDREKVIKGLQEAVDWLSTETSLTVIDQWVVRDALALLKAQEPREMSDAELMDAIRKAPIIVKPAVDAAPVVHARWYDKGSLSCRCSCCGCKSDKEYNYCPNCGAKMDKED